MECVTVRFPTSNQRPVFCAACRRSGVHRTAPHRTAPHCTALHCTTPHFIALHYTAPQVGRRGGVHCTLYARQGRAGQGRAWVHCTMCGYAGASRPIQSAMGGLVHIYNGGWPAANFSQRNGLSRVAALRRLCTLCTVYAVYCVLHTVYCILYTVYARPCTMYLYCMNLYCMYLYCILYYVLMVEAEDEVLRCRGSTEVL